MTCTRYSSHSLRLERDVALEDVRAEDPPAELDCGELLDRLAEDSAAG